MSKKEQTQEIKKVTEDELRELIKYAPEFQPFRDKLNEVRLKVAYRQLAKMKELKK